MSAIEFRKGAIDASDCLSQAWELIREKYILFFGMTIVFLVVSMGFGFIPYAGEILAQIFVAPLMCGIYYALIVKMRGEEPQFSMMFEKFGQFLPAALISLIQVAPWILVSAAGYFFISLTPSEPDAPGGAISGIPDVFGQNFPTALVLISVAAFVISLILSVLFYFAYQLMADRQLKVTEAIKLSCAAAIGNLGGIILLFLLEFLVMLVGLLALCIGFFFALPLIYAMNAVAYRSVFPDRQPSAFDAPPRPDAYGSAFGTFGNN